MIITPIFIQNMTLITDTGMTGILKDSGGQSAAIFGSIEIPLSVDMNAKLGCLFSWLLLEEKERTIHIKEHKRSTHNSQHFVSFSFWLLLLFRNENEHNPIHWHSFPFLILLFGVCVCFLFYPFLLDKLESIVRVVFLCCI